MASPQAGQAILEELGASKFRGRDLRRLAMNLLAALSGYDWCGVYRLEEGVLVLDEFDGEPTEHARIPVGTGVCGTAVAEGRNQIVLDVRQVKSYLSCSVKTRSEIVVLIRDETGDILGQIDVDGHEVGNFDAADESFLEAVAGLLAKRWV
jgi:GAF domain-containing protein